MEMLLLIKRFYVFDVMLCPAVMFDASTASFISLMIDYFVGIFVLIFNTCLLTNYRYFTQKKFKAIFFIIQAVLI